MTVDGKCPLNIVLLNEVKLLGNLMALNQYLSSKKYVFLKTAPLKI